MILFYRLFLLLYGLGIRAAALWKPKAKAWLAGRRGQWDRLAAGIPGRIPGRKRFWIHCASLGEFEQARPVIEAIRRDWPDAVVVLSFFSPSGYEIRKDYELVDTVCFLPMDGASNAKRFVDLVDPDAALFVKYEFWHYYLKTLHERGIPAILVSGAFRESQPFFKFWGGFFRSILRRFSVLTVQDDASLLLLQRIGLGDMVTLTGDTRYDRVLDIARNPVHIEKLDAFCPDYLVVVAGSTWPKDEELLAASWNHIERTLQTSIGLVIAPHELGEDHLQSIERAFRGVGEIARYSDPVEAIRDADILIIDNIGMLSRLYSYGDFAYIGGGFNPGGIHNVLEPAVFGLPVLMGPVYEKFGEAVELVNRGYAFPVETVRDVVSLLTLKFKGSKLGQLAELRSEIGEFVKSRGGATERVMQVLREAL